MLRQYTMPGQFMADERRIRADSRWLIVGRYSVFFLGAAMLAWLGTKTLLLGESATLIGASRIIMVSILGPALVWLISDKEINLLGQLERHNKQLEQRNRENRALNRMAQSHLAECLSDWQQPGPARVEPTGPAEGPAVFTRDSGNGQAETVREDQLKLVMESSRLVGARRD